MNTIRAFKANIHNSLSDDGSQYLGFMDRTKLAASSCLEPLELKSTWGHGGWRRMVCGGLMVVVAVQREGWRRRRRARAPSTVGTRSRGGRETGVTCLHYAWYSPGYD